MTIIKQYNFLDQISMKTHLLHSAIIATFAMLTSSCSNELNFDEYSFPKTDVNIKLLLSLNNHKDHKLLDSAAVHVQDQLFPVSSWFGNISINGDGKSVKVRDTQATPFVLSSSWSGYLSKKSSSPTIQVYSCMNNNSFDTEAQKEWNIQVQPTVALLTFSLNDKIEIETKLGKAEINHFFTKENYKSIYIYADYDLDVNKHAIFKPIEVKISINGNQHTVTCEAGKIYNFTEALKVLDF